MNKKQVFLLFIFLLAVSAANAAVVDQEIEEKLNAEDEVSVIIIIKDRPAEQRFFQASSERGLLEEKKQMIKNQQQNVLSRLNLKEKKGFFITSKQDLKLRHKYSTINGLSGNLTKQGLEKLKNDPDVENIHINRQFHIALDSSILQINADDAWKLQINSANITGQGEAICILDTGIDYNHSSLGSGWGSKVIGGYDYVNDDNDPVDDHGHGTHVAGIAASDNNTYKGAAPDAKLIAIKVLDSSGNGNAADIIAGIDWCTDNASAYNISVISMSLGDCSNHSTYCNSDPLAPSINTAVGQGIIVMAAAGNGPGGGSCTGINNTAGPASPACIENATAIGAVNGIDSINYQRGALFEIFAPGLNICSSRLSGDNDGSACGDGTFISKSGTSMSTPHAAGAAALLQQFNKLQNGSALTPAQIRQALNDTGKLIDDSADSGYNFSRIDVYAAVQSLDDISPNNITFVNPAPENNTSTFNISVIINVTVEDYLNNISSCLLEWNSANESMIKVGSGKSVYCYINKSIAGHGLFYYKVYANDSENNFNASESRQIYINDTAPNITSFYPSASNINIAEPTNQTFNITYLDINNDTITIAWYKNGTIVGNSDNYAFSGNYSTDGSYNITVIINDSSLTDSQSWNFTINNTETTPQAVNITLTSTDFLNRTNGTLTASWDFYDPDGGNQADNETKWYNNSIEIISLANLTSISSGNTTKEETWLFSVRVYDGINWSNWYNSSPITIQNTPPEMDTISDINVNQTDLVNITVNAADLDNDTLTYFINNTNFNQADNIFTWNTTANDSGAYIVNITVSDSAVNISQLVAVNVCEDNDGDGYGDGCSLGSDCDDNDNSTYPGTSCSRTCYTGSTYDANCECTGGTYTCGGGGGSSSSSKGLTHTADIETGQYRKSLSKKDKVNFQIDSEPHSATVSVVALDYVNLIIESAPLLVTVYKFTTEKVDLDNDAVYDLSITLNNIISSKADLTFKLIREPIFKEIFVEEEFEEMAEDADATEEIEETNVIEEPALEEQPAEEFKITEEEIPSIFEKESIIYIVLVSFLISIIILSAFRHKKKRYHPHEVKISKIRKNPGH
jgi:subtilisin family serine protease